MTQKKVTLKELSLEVDRLREVTDEKDNRIKALDEKVNSLQNWAQGIYANIYKKIDEIDQHHCKNENILQQRIVDVDKKVIEVVEKQENKEEPVKVENKALNNSHDCRQCSLTFQRKYALRKHIQAVHPKQVKCDLCAENFDQIWKLEVHMKTHTTEKCFNCEICDKSFVLKWRLRKHIEGHSGKNSKFCHYYNNSKQCIYEETSGCMFRHETAPSCKDLSKCKFTKCQYSHVITEQPTADIYDEVEDEHEKGMADEVKNVGNLKCAKCTFYTGEELYHTNDPIKECTQCDYETKCQVAYDEHWASTPGHVFPSERVKTMIFR